MAYKLAAGILPFFDNGESVLLGKEFRERENNYVWMEFGGKQENNETLAETACREANEETAYTLNITLDKVLSAEQKGHYIDYYNEKTNVFYRKYCIKLSEKPDPEMFVLNSKDKDHVEKIEWKYFKASDVIFNHDGNILGTEERLYSTMCFRLQKLKEAEFFRNEFN